MTKFLAVLAVTAMSIVLGVAILMYGWGLEPKSWWWIIGGGVVGRFLVELAAEIARRE